SNSDSTSSTDSDTTSEANAGGNTFTNGNNTIINVSDNSTTVFAVALSAIAMLQALNGSSTNVEPILSNINNMHKRLMDDDNTSRQAVLNANNELKNNQQLKPNRSED